MTPAARWFVGGGLLASLVACGADDGLEQAEESAKVAEPVIDARRSLAVTELEVLARFPLERVMNQLARESGVPGLTGLSLFRQWWDTQNPSAGRAQATYCDSESDLAGRPLLNGYPYDCRPGPSEGAQANCTSFRDPACAYIPIGLFNRYDLAPEDGAHCGEYRVVYAKQSGQVDRNDRNLVIFEAVVANPHPRQGLQGCRRMVEEWAALSSIARVKVRADRLEDLYFRGTGPFPPVIRFAHYGENERNLGQVRTNQFMVQGAPRIWTLREFKLTRECDGRRCTALFVPVTAKNNPIGALFGDPTADRRAAAFQDMFVRDNVGALAATTLTDISMGTPDEFNSGQSHSSGSSEMDYAGPLAVRREGFRQRIWQVLGELGSSVTPEQLVARARTQTCAGCHQLSNGAELGEGLIWPPSLGFVHVSEEAPETVDGSVRYRISPLLVSSFLPHRERVMIELLKERPARRRGFGWTIGGRITH